MLPSFDSATGCLPPGEREAMGAGRAAQKRRFGGELLPDVVEAASGLSFAEFFSHDRDGTAKGVVVLILGGKP